MSAFRDLGSRFADANAQVLGVSTNDVETQTKFAESLKLPFPLLSDKDATAAKAYGVYMPEKNFAQRVTFVIGKDGKVVKVLEGKDAIDPTPALTSCPMHKADK
jgi:thioredoxin-dependent peroxiredoxin